MASIIDAESTAYEIEIIEKSTEVIETSESVDEVSPGDEIIKPESADTSNQGV